MSSPLKKLENKQSKLKDLLKEKQKRLKEDKEIDDEFYNSEDEEGDVMGYAQTQELIREIDDLKEDIQDTEKKIQFLKKKKKPSSPKVLLSITKLEKRKRFPIKNVTAQHPEAKSAKVSIVYFANTSLHAHFPSLKRDIVFKYNAKDNTWQTAMDGLSDKMRWRFYV
jgi:hypothetical protein